MILTRKEQIAAEQRRARLLLTDTEIDQLFQKWDELDRKKYLMRKIRKGL